MDGLNERSRDYLNNVGEPYSLYAAITKVLPIGKIIDIGTCFGTSALSWTASGHQVVTYDINNQFGLKNPLIEFRQENLLDKNASKDYIKRILRETVLVCIDVDPHGGIKERQLIELLKHFNWCGPVVLDDIYLNGPMTWFWESLDNKVDLTHFGHTTGTGVLFL